MHCFSKVVANEPQHTSKSSQLPQETSVPNMGILYSHFTQTKEERREIMVEKKGRRQRRSSILRLMTVVLCEWSGAVVARRGKRKTGKREEAALVHASYVNKSFHAISFMHAQPALLSLSGSESGWGEHT